MNETNKLVFKTAGFALGGVLVATCYIVAMFAFFAPGVMANLAGDMGDTRLDAVYTARVYDRTPTDTNLFKTLYKAIGAGERGLVKHYGKIWYKIDGARRDQITEQFDAWLTAQNPNASDAIENYSTRQYLEDGYDKYGH